MEELDAMTYNGLSIHLWRNVRPGLIMDKVYNNGGM